MRSALNSVVCFGLVIQLAAPINAKSVMWGAIGPEDLFLRRERVQANAIIRNTTEAVYKFPREWDDNEFPITAVKVMDYLPEKNTVVRLENGGVNATFLTLRFESSMNHGIRVTVELYGKDHEP